MSEFSTNGYPLLERQKLQELQRTLMLGEGLVTFGLIDNPTGAQRYGTEVSSTARPTPSFSIARAKLASCAVAVALATSSALVVDDQTCGLQFPNETGAVRPSPAPMAAVGIPAEPAAVEFKWNRSIYRARKKAKEYGS